MFVLLASGSIGASAMMTPERTAPPKQYSIALNQHANGLRRDTSNAPVNNKQTVKKYHVKTTRNLTVPGVTHHTPVHTRPHFRNPLKKNFCFAWTQQEWHGVQSVSGFRTESCFIISFYLADVFTYLFIKAYLLRMKFSIKKFLFGNCCCESEYL